MTAMRARQRRRTAAALLAMGAATAIPLLTLPARQGAGAAPDRCAAPAEIALLGADLPRTAERLRRGQALTIVTLGSSSTAGAGATRPELSYPSRLAALLKQRLPGMPIRVVNRGVGGETARDMAARLDRDVLAEKPDLVIWQIGTNSVLHDEDPLDEAEVVRQGIARLREAGADILLMDLQYAPAVLAHPRYRGMLQVIAAVARSEQVPVFHRFALMRHWAEDGEMALPVMLSVDRLHMTDASYDCLAQALADLLVTGSADTLRRTARAPG